MAQLIRVHDKGAIARRRISVDKQGPTVVHQKPGPLQTIFNLPPDEVVEHSYSCALERSFLYHGRMYVSAWHICFHSNVFSKQMKEKEQSALRAHSSSIKATQKSSELLAVSQADIALPDVEKTLQPFIKDDVLVSIIKEDFPCTAEQFFTKLLNDDSKFTHQYRAERKDSEIKLEQWHVADRYSGLVREIAFRSICNNPMCPPDTAMTEWQHSDFSADKSVLVFETVQQAHDVPFGSYFEVHARWRLETISESSCRLDIKVGAHFKKWCVMQSKIKTGAVNEYKKDVELMLKVARAYLERSEPTVVDDVNNKEA